MPQRKQPMRPNTLRDRRSWHIDKSVSLGQILSAVLVAIGIGGPILVWGRAMESRVVALEVVNAEANKTDTKRDNDTREQRLIVTGRMDKIEERLLQIQLSISQLTNSPAAVVIRK